MSYKSILSVMFVSLIAHSLCCVMPVICFVIGLTSMGHYLEFMHEYEGLLIVLNLVSIAVGYYMYYLYKKSSCSHKHCHPSRKPFWIITVSSILLMIIPILYELS